MRIDGNTGYVGLGTTSPQERLELFGHLRIDNGTGNGNYIYFHENGTPQWTIKNKPWGTCQFTIYDEVGSRTSLGIEPVTGNVGIGTTEPDARLHVGGDAKISQTLTVEGNMVIEGAVTGSIGPGNGAPIARPAYDSGWWEIMEGMEIEFVHGIGGNIDNYVVDLQFKETATSYYGIHNKNMGSFWHSVAETQIGAHWFDLTTSSVKVARYHSSDRCDEVRVRIWVYN
jgi:hypothetical protein